MGDSRLKSAEPTKFKQLIEGEGENKVTNIMDGRDWDIFDVFINQNHFSLSKPVIVESHISAE